MSHPDLTVALTTFNRAKSGFLRQAIDAILGQTLGDFEFLVLDNHSDDETPEVVSSYRDPRLVYIRQPPGGHAGTNHDSAFRNARGEFVLVAHDDDVMEPTLVERQMRFLATRPDLACVAANVSLIDEEGRQIQARLLNIDHDVVFEVGRYLVAYLTEQVWLPAPTFMVRRDLHLRHLATPTASIADLSDVAPPSVAPPTFWSDVLNVMRMNMAGPIGVVADPLLRYRQHSGQESAMIHRAGLQTDLLEHLLDRLHEPMIRAHGATIRGAWARSKMRDLLLAHEGNAGDGLRSAAEMLRDSVSREEGLGDLSPDVVLPLDIALGSFGLDPVISLDRLGKLPVAPVMGRAGRAYRVWATRKASGQTVFDGCSFREIAIFGSLLTAALLVLDAKGAGIRVACCLDSNEQRIGRRLLGVPIVPHSALKERVGIDSVVLSTERDSDSMFRGILTPHLPPTVTRVCSWKDLLLGVADRT